MTDISGQTKFLKFWFPLIVYSGIIFCVSSVSYVKVPLSEVQFDKVFHILEYMPFGFLLARGVYWTKSSISGKVLLGIVFAASLFYGISDEVHQSFVPGRDAGIGDVLADIIGGLLGGYLYLVLVNKIKSK